MLKEEDTRSLKIYLKKVSIPPPCLCSSPTVFLGLGKTEMLQILHTALLEPRVLLIILWQLFSRQSMLPFMHLK